MCLALISGLLLIWPGTHVCADRFTAEPSDTNIEQLSLEALAANQVSFES